MSGGVDSSLCAHLLTEQGYEVTGVFLECWRAPGCRTDADRQDALKIALSLDIPFQVLDFKQTYHGKVVEYFFNEYEAGRTPNPDILCNKEIKFGLFFDWAMEHDFDYVATGHYADITTIDNQTHLTVPKDTHKDQTYFLYRLQQEQLEHILFPLAPLTKTQVRQEAEKRNLHVADKKDSVGICFIGDINVHGFLKDRLGEKPGPVLDTDGNVIGSHKGLWFFTIGQRHGFEIDKKTIVKLDNGQSFEKDNIPPFYVIKKIPSKNALVVGFGAETYQSKIVLEDLHYISPDLEITPNQEVLARVRHTGELLPAVCTGITTSEITFELHEPVKGIAAGQSVVLYRKQDQHTICLGGGVISQKSHA